MSALVLGANGFIGRWLVLELLTRGRPVAAATRPGRAAALTDWLSAHGAPADGLTTVTADITRPDLGLSPADGERLTDVRDVYNLAALYRFGLTRPEARAANHDGALHVARWTAGRPGARRLVHLSGYRVGDRPVPLPPAEAERLYRTLGAYEASKSEGDSALRALAPELGLPLSVVSPSAVIGHSATGEAGQYLGLATMVDQLHQGRLPALPGSRRTFVPVVAVDHLARFLAATPEHDRDPVARHTVLDPTTPELPGLIGLLATHLGVRPPRLRIPVGLVRRLPRSLTGADPETLSFLSEDRYDTASAERLARAAGLDQAPVADVLRRWADRLVAEDFGRRPGA